MGFESVDGATGPDASECAFEVVAKFLDAFGFTGVEFGEGVSDCFSHGCDGRGVFCAGSAAVLLGTAVQAGDEGQAAF